MCINVVAKAIGKSRNNVEILSHTKIRGRRSFHFGPSVLEYGQTKQNENLRMTSNVVIRREPLKLIVLIVIIQPVACEKNRRYVTKRIIFARNNYYVAAILKQTKKISYFFYAALNYSMQNLYHHLSHNIASSSNCFTISLLLSSQ